MRICVWRRIKIELLQTQNNTDTHSMQFYKQNITQTIAVVPGSDGKYKL